MKKLLFTLLSALALPAMAQGPYEQFKAQLTQPAGYVCYRTAETLKIDGKLDEASWQKAEDTCPFSDISGEGFAKPKYQTTARMLWDDDFLYVGGILEEENIKALLTQRDTIIYRDNDFEVFIDPDGDAHHYFEIEINARNVLFDLLLNRPYRTGGNFLIAWDCPGIVSAIHCEGTLNNPNDTDKFWSVEMAIPRQALTWGFESPLKAGNYWRINFSRVQWLKPKGPEENWVWMPTGRIDMHMPDRWGYLYFSDKTVGTAKETFSYPYNMGVYKLVWSVFYAQQDYKAKTGKYTDSMEKLGFTASYLQNIQKSLPGNVNISLEATANTYYLQVAAPFEKATYTLTSEGRFGYQAQK